MPELLSATAGSRDILGGHRPPLVLPQSIPKGEFHCVAIGIDDYIEYPKLARAANGARAIAQLFASKFGFARQNITVLLNAEATRDRIIAVLRQIVQSLGPHDSLVLFYAGHGHYDKTFKTGSWIPVAARLNSPADCLEHDYIKTLLRAARARHIIVIADSCFSGDLLRVVPTQAVTISAPHVSYAFGRTSRHVLTSGALEPVPDGGTTDHSVFTAYVLKELEETRQPWLLGLDLFQRVRGGVAINTDQHPQFGHLHGAGGEVGGEFVLFNEHYQSPDPASVAAAADPAHFVVCEAQIEPLHIEVTVIAGRRIETPGLPPIPEAILVLEGRIQGLSQAIDQLQAGTHPSLEPARAAVRQMEAQLEALTMDLTQASPSPSDNLRAIGKAAINSRPTSLSQLCSLAPELPTSVLLPFIHRSRNVQRAQEALDRARGALESACTKELERLKADATEAQTRLLQLNEADLNSCLEIIFAKSPESNDFPLETWNKTESLLTNRRYPWSDHEILRRAELVFEQRLKKHRRQIRDQINDQVREKQLDGADWVKAATNGQFEALKSYLNRRPKGDYVEQAKILLAKMEAQEWQKHIAKANGAELSFFLRRWPDGKYANDARERLRAIRATLDRRAKTTRQLKNGFKNAAFAGCFATLLSAGLCGMALGGGQSPLIRSPWIFSVSTTALVAIAGFLIGVIYSE